MSARVLFGFLLGFSSIGVLALAVDARADLGSAGASAGVVASIDWVGETEAAGSGGSGEDDSSSPNIGGGATLDQMEFPQARVQASTGSTEPRPSARREPFLLRLAKNDGSGKGGKASGSEGKSGSDGK